MYFQWSSLLNLTDPSIYIFGPFRFDFVDTYPIIYVVVNVGIMDHACQSLVFRTFIHEQYKCQRIPNDLPVQPYNV